MSVRRFTGFSAALLRDLSFGGPGRVTGRLIRKTSTASDWVFCRSDSAAAAVGATRVAVNLGAAAIECERVCKRSFRDFAALAARLMLTRA